METSTVIAVGGAIVSGLGMVFSILSAQAAKVSARASERANELSQQDRQDQKAELQAAAQAAQKADVHVIPELRRTARGDWHVVVRNDGPASASRLAIEIHATEDSRPKFLAGPTDNKNREYLEPHRSWPLLTMNGTNPSKVCPITGTVSWIDRANKSHVQDFRIDGGCDEPPFLEL